MLNTKRIKNAKSTSWGDRNKNTESVHFTNYNHAMSSNVRQTFVREDSSGNYAGQVKKKHINRVYHRKRSGSASRIISSKSNRKFSVSQGKFRESSAQTIGSYDRLRRLKAKAIHGSMN